MILSTDYPANENYAVPKYTIQWDSLQNTFNVSLRVLPCFTIGIAACCYGHSLDYRNEKVSRGYLNTKCCAIHKDISVADFRWKPEQLAAPATLYVAPVFPKGYEAMVKRIEMHLYYPKQLD